MRAREVEQKTVGLARPPLTVKRAGHAPLPHAVGPEEGQSEDGAEFAQARGTREMSVLESKAAGLEAAEEGLDLTE